MYSIDTIIRFIEFLFQEDQELLFDRHKSSCKRRIQKKYVSYEKIYVC